MTDSPPTASELSRYYDEYARAYPEIRWALADFAQACRADGGTGASLSIDDYVRLACLAQRPGAANVLDRDYVRPLRGRVFQICQSADSTDAVLQQLREELLLPPSLKLAAYKSSGSFRVWLAVVASRTALDNARSAGVRARREVELHECLEAFATGPEQYCESAQLRLAFREALRAAVKALPERERQALRLHLVSQWNITQIGRVFSVHRATVARWLISAKEQLQGLLRAELVERMGTAAPDPGQLFQGLPTRLDVRLSQVFATTGVSKAALG